MLGPIEVRDGGSRCPVGRPMQRAVLAVLLVHAGEVVSLDRLVEELWPTDRQPAGPVNLVHGYVSRLRRALGTLGAADRLTTRRPGYQLRVEPGELDAVEFQRLATGAATAARRADEVAAAGYAAALALWRGAAFADVPATPAVAAEAGRLAEARLSATEGRIAAELRLGRGPDLVAELTALVRAHPLRESLHGHRMLALYRAGRQAEALAAYRDARRTLVTELGLEPGPELRRLHAALLHADPALTGPAPYAGTLPDPTPVPSPSRADSGPSAGPGPSGPSPSAGPSPSGPGPSADSGPSAGPTPSGPSPSADSGPSAGPRASGPGPSAEPSPSGPSPSAGPSPSGPSPSADSGPSAGPTPSGPSPSGPSPAGPGPAAEDGMYAAGPGGGQAPAGRVAPAQLPADAADFTGRDGLVAELVQILGTPTGPAVPIAAISGRGGVGKTALAVHAAHRIRAGYPDGQLFVTLRGTTAAPLPPGEVLGRFLRALGVDSQAVPADLEEQADLYRSRLAGRRVLVVLDDAADERQVEPLLPGSAGCAVLVTSRTRLARLAGGHRLDVDALEFAPALELLRRAAGPDRVAAEPAAAAQIIDFCGGLPLAVRIAAAKLAAAPHRTVARLAGLLADERHRLDHLVAGDLDVRASFSVSYRQLAEREQLAFRRLGLLATPDVAGWAVAALLDTDLTEADRLVDALVTARLLDVVSPGPAARYRLHDLLHLYAAELAEPDPAPARQAALARAFAGWLALAEAADAGLPGDLRPALNDAAPRWSPAPTADPTRPTAAAAGPAARTATPTAHPPRATGPTAGPAGRATGSTAAPDWTAELVASPADWFAAERPALVAAVGQAAAAGQHELAWNLATALRRYLAVHHHRADWQQTHDQALTATRAAGNRRGTATLLCGLGGVHIGDGRYADALDCFDTALDLFAGVADQPGMAYALWAASDVHRILDQLTASVECCRRALAIFTAAGDTRARAYAQLALAVTVAGQDRLTEAGATMAEALRAFADLPDRYGEALTCAQLGRVHRDQGNLDAAASCFERCLAISVELGDRLGEAAMLRDLAGVDVRRGRPAEALRLLTRGLGVSGQVGQRLAQAMILTDLADLHRDLGQLDEAAGALRRADQLYGELRLTRRRIRVLIALGDVAARGGDPATARLAWDNALILVGDEADDEARTALAARLSAAGPGR